MWLICTILAIDTWTSIYEKQLYCQQIQSKVEEVMLLEAIQPDYSFLIAPRGSVIATRRSANSTTTSGNQCYDDTASKTSW